MDWGESVGESLLSAVAYPEALLREVQISLENIFQDTVANI
jgi:hypothetical protein